MFARDLDIALVIGSNPQAINSCFTAVEIMYIVTNHVNDGQCICAVAEAEAWKRNKTELFQNPEMSVRTY